MKTFKTVLCAAAILILFPAMQSRTAPEPQEAPNLLNHLWSASWIACPGAPRRAFGVYLFRRDFMLPSAPRHFVIHASADNRYQLYVNGSRVLEGPAKGDLYHWRYETLDLAPYLHAGANALAAIVWNFAEDAPMAQMTNETGFVLAGDGDAAAVNTGPAWKATAAQAYSMIPVGGQTHHAYTVVGPGERIDGSLYPWGWQQADYDDAAWRPAIVIVRAGPRGIQDSPSRWMLVPRNIPLMQSIPQRLVDVRRYSGPAEFHPTAAFLQGHSPLAIPANAHVSLLLDQTFETTAYPLLVTSGGRGAVVTATYAEALFDAHGQKGNRNDIAGKHIMGYTDQFLPGGGAHRAFQPLWWRAYRYIKLDITTADAPLTLDDFYGEFTAFPFTRKARFTSDDASLEKIMRVGWRTARLCAHETYMDCPYYEQLQYVGDTRIQALISLYMTGDDRLVKNAIECINASRTSEGLTQSRFPSRLPQYIPPFSLYWIGMMHDLWWYRGGAGFLRPYLTNARGVLAWYQARLAPSGLLGNLPWWDFADWTTDFRAGVPPQEADGQSSILTLEFAAALEEQADLESAFGSAARAAEDRALAARVTRAVYHSCWDAGRGLLADTPARSHFSQHATILGVLTDAIPAPEQRAAMRRVLSDASLTQCSYYFRFYLFKAMNKAGLGDEIVSQLEPWRQMLALGLTTFAEKPEPTRSDCHAWSAHPDFDLLAQVAGIEPASPGFGQVALRPHPGPLTRLAASVPVPQGEVSVSYRLNGKQLAADITLPSGLKGNLYWNGREYPLHSGAQHVEAR